MPEPVLDEGFERHVAEQLWAYSGQVVAPFDAVEIAHRAARGQTNAGAGSFFGGLVPAPVMWALLSALLLVALAATAIAAGWLRLPPPPDSSPLPTAATASPSPSPSPSPSEPVVSPTAGPTAPTTPTPTPAARPTISPALTPSPPPTESPSPPPTPALGEWRQITDFPRGDGGLQFVVVRDVAAAGPGFVAVGMLSDGAGNVAEGYAWTSADGQSWSMITSDAFARAKLTTVVGHLGNVYALGPIPTDDPDYPDLGAYNVWRSADGSTWERLPQPAAFAEPAEIAGVTSAGETLVAWGRRNVEEGGQTVVRPGIWTWTPTADGEWQLADTLPDTYDVQRMAYGNGVLVALGNSRADGAPWRTIWFSTDEGRTWSPGDARLIDDPTVTLEDIAATTDPAPADHPGGVYAAVGWQGRDAEVYPFSLGTTYERDWFVGGALTGYVPYQWERVAAIPGGFLVLGTEYRFEVTPCAPEPCRELIPVAARAWTASTVGTQWGDGFGGLVWDEAPAPAAPLWFYQAVAVGPGGVVVIASDPDFDRSIWFAPLAAPLP